MSTGPWLRVCPSGGRGQRPEVMSSGVHTWYTSPQTHTVGTLVVIQFATRTNSVLIQTAFMY